METEKKRRIPGVYISMMKSRGVMPGGSELMLDAGDGDAEEDRAAKHIRLTLLVPGDR